MSLQDRGLSRDCSLKQAPRLGPRTTSPAPCVHLPHLLGQPWASPHTEHRLPGAPQQGILSAGCHSAARRPPGPRTKAHEEDLRLPPRNLLLCQPGPPSPEERQREKGDFLFLFVSTHRQTGSRTAGLTFRPGEDSFREQGGKFPAAPSTVAMKVVERSREGQSKGRARCCPGLMLGRPGPPPRGTLLARELCVAPGGAIALIFQKGALQAERWGKSGALLCTFS